MENDNRPEWQIIVFDFLKKISINLALAAIFWIAVAFVCGYRPSPSGGYLYLIFSGLLVFWTTIPGVAFISFLLTRLAAEIAEMFSGAEDLKGQKARFESEFEKRVKERAASLARQEIALSCSHYQKRESEYLKLRNEYSEKINLVDRRAADIELIEEDRTRLLYTISKYEKKFYRTKKQLGVVLSFLDKEYPDAPQAVRHIRKLLGEIENVQPKSPCSE